MAHTLRPRLLSLAALLLANCPAFALQAVDGRDGVAVEAIISIKEPTRIRIEGAPITDVFGNIYSSHCGGTAPPSAGTGTASAPAINPGGEVVVECDKDKGEIYVRPTGVSQKPVNLFVSSAHATYTLVLRRADVPADTIVIRDKTPRMARAEVHDAFQGPAGRNSSHIRGLKAMLVAMASDRVPTDVRVEEVHIPKALWGEAKFTLMRVYEGRGLIGEKYLLTNVSNDTMVLAEQEFDREDGNVAAVSIENHNLRPGESTSVYVIRMGSQ